MARLNYLELSVADSARASDFYSQAFGWTFADFGPTYAATTSRDANIGLQADDAQKTVAPLAVIEVDDLQATLAAVKAAGGTVTAPIFGFPGGHRFHFQDTDGNELAAMTTEAGD